jgi:riboflavin biosynthesis pyrimidine reductase
MRVSELAPFTVLTERATGKPLPLPPALAALYGPLALAEHPLPPEPPGRPHLLANFITTLDGVVAYDLPGKPGGGDISGGNTHDRALMGLLRAVADAVVVGAGTLRVVPGHLWTPSHIYRPLAAEYQALREALGRPRLPMNVIVSGHGALDLSLRVFQSGAVPVLIVTTTEGAATLRRQTVPSGVAIAEAAERGTIPARAVVEAIQATQPSDRILVEGGPHLLGDFLAEGLLDEQFLTLAPQIAGRSGGADRLGLVAGHLFAPQAPVSARLISVRQAGNHLFLRYTLAR